MNKIFNRVMRGCIILLICLSVTIIARAFTRMVLIEKLGIENSATELILFDLPHLQHKTDNNKEVPVIDYEKEYPFIQNGYYTNFSSDKVNYKNTSVKSKSEKYVSKVNVIKDKIEKYTADNLICYDLWLKFCREYKKLINWDYPDENDSVIVMNNGYYTNAEKLQDDNDIQEMALALNEFNKFLKDRDIIFYYVNAGSKVNPEDKQLNVVQQKNEYSNENADKLINELNKFDINIMDMRKLMLEDELDWYGMYYKTDHHWTTEAGLWCARKITERLNKDGFQFEPNKYLETSYSMNCMKEFWIGSQGRKYGVSEVGLEDYTIILPDYETNIEVNIPSRDYNKVGSYNEVVFQNDLLEEIKNYTKEDYQSKMDAYNLVAWRNDDLGIYKNYLTDNDKKILMIQDSFAWYTSSFIACDVKELHVINPGNFRGSIMNYIEQNDFDAVILMFCEGNIDPIEWSKHNSFFDLR